MDINRSRDGEISNLRIHETMDFVAFEMILHGLCRRNRAHCSVLLLILVVLNAVTCAGHVIRANFRSGETDYTSSEKYRDEERTLKTDPYSGVRRHTGIDNASEKKTVDQPQSDTSAYPAWRASDEILYTNIMHNIENLTTSGHLSAEKFNDILWSLMSTFRKKREVRDVSANDSKDYHNDGVTPASRHNRVHLRRLGIKDNITSDSEIDKELFEKFELDGQAQARPALECQTPVAEAHHIQREYFFNETNKIFHPEYVVVHKCRPKYGCCGDAPETWIRACHAKTSNTIVRVIMEKEKQWSDPDSIFRPRTLWIVNHTECYCKHVSRSDCHEDGREYKCPKYFELSDDTDVCECGCTNGTSDYKNCLSVMNGTMTLPTPCFHDAGSPCLPPKCTYGEFDVKTGRCPQRKEAPRSSPASTTPKEMDPEAEADTET